MTEAPETEAPAAEAPAAVKDTKNGVTRPKKGTQTGRVWDIADEKSAAAGEPAKRKDVIEAFVALGGNKSTGATQYGRWRKYHGLGKEQKTVETPGAEAGETSDAAATAE